VRLRALQSIGRLLFLLSSLALLFLAACTGTKPPQPSVTPTQPVTQQELEKRILNLEGEITAHDPTIIKAGNAYYLFTTGPGIPIHCSPDLINWRTCGQVFDRNPEWVSNAIPGVKDLWAPDIAFF